MRQQSFSVILLLAGVEASSYLGGWFGWGGRNRERPVGEKEKPETSQSYLDYRSIDDYSHSSDIGIPDRHEADMINSVDEILVNGDGEWDSNASSVTTFSDDEEGLFGIMSGEEEKPVGTILGGETVVIKDDYRPAEASQAVPRRKKRNRMRKGKSQTVEQTEKPKKLRRRPSIPASTITVEPKTEPTTTVMVVERKETVKTAASHKSNRPKPKRIVIRAGPEPPPTAEETNEFEQLEALFSEFPPVKLINHIRVSGEFYLDADFDEELVEAIRRIEAEADGKNYVTIVSASDESFEEAFSFHQRQISESKESAESAELKELKDLGEDDGFDSNPDSTYGGLHSNSGPPAAGLHSNSNSGSSSSGEHLPFYLPFTPTILPTPPFDDDDNGLSTCDACFFPTGWTFTRPKSPSAAGTPRGMLVGRAVPPVRRILGGALQDLSMLGRRRRRLLDGAGGGGGEGAEMVVGASTGCASDGSGRDDLVDFQQRRTVVLDGGEARRGVRRRGFPPQSSPSLLSSMRSRIGDILIPIPSSSSSSEDDDSMFRTFSRRITSALSPEGDQSRPPMITPPTLESDEEEVSTLFPAISVLRSRFWTADDKEDKGDNGEDNDGQSLFGRLLR